MFALLLTFVALQAATAPPATAALVNEVTTLAASPTNEARFDALTAMLNARKLAFVVEPFKIEKPLRLEPRTEGRNVVVTLGEGSREVVIGAHYDAARIQDGSLSKGAVDNAASAVILIHLAQMLAAEKLPFRLRVVWFDMEELGLLGSKEYVQKHASDKTSAMLNFDVNGYGNTVLFGPDRRDNAEVRHTLVRTCATEDITCVPFPQMPPGDDQSFVSAGIPTVSIGVLPAIEAHQVWLMMNAGANSGLATGMAPPIFRTIHTAGDTPDKVNGDTMTMMLRFAVSLVRSFGQR